MDGARPAGCFSLDRTLAPYDEEDYEEGEVSGDEDEEEGGEDVAREGIDTLWMPWQCDLVCSAEHLSREACEDGTGTPVYRLPLGDPATPPPPSST